MLSERQDLPFDMGNIQCESALKRHIFIQASTEGAKRGLFIDTDCVFK